MSPQPPAARTRRANALRAVSRSIAEPLEGRLLLATTQVPGFQDGVYTTGLTAPTSMEFAPDGRLFITQQTGQLRVSLPGNTSVLATPFVTLPTSANGERGLESVTLDPNFMTNGYLYVYYTANTPAVHNRVSRFTAVDADPDPAVYRPGNTAVAGSELPILDLENLSSATNHNGGAIHFGPDGKLYVAVGENANPSNSQTLANRLGKMLRINPDGTIPTDNPFYTQATGANRAIWALGLRNPFTFAFEPGTGRMFINDVGQSAFEEVNDGIAGSNYGWPNTEGYRTNQPLPTIGTYRDPLLAYGRTVGTTVTGGAFYRPPVQNFPQQYVGKYFFGDYGADWIRYIDPATNRPPINDFAVGALGPVDYEVGPDGALYYLSIDGRQVGRITWVGPRITTQPQSQTVDVGAPVTFTVAAAGPGTLTYQWRRNNVDIPGATGASYTIPSVTAEDGGASFTVVVTNSSASVTSDPAVLGVRPDIPSVVGRYVFYNNSRFDGRDPDATEADDAAIATDKKPLLWGQAASFENMTGYSRGLNGIMVDLDNVAETLISGEDFLFQVGRGEGKWVAAPAPRRMFIRPNAGAGGSDRVMFTWDDSAIVNRWLKVTYKPKFLNLAPGIVDEFYFGNLRGEVGNAPTDPTRQAVNVIDQVQTRAAMGTMVATISNLYDHNRDGRVNALDRVVTARNRGQSLALFTAPPPPPAAAAVSTLRATDLLR